MCRESLPPSSACILLINLPNSHPVQVKTNPSSGTSKHCYVMSLQPWLRKMFQRLWAEEEGVFCFLWLGDLGQATALDVLVNLNWFMKECSTLQIYTFDSHAYNTDSGTWTVTEAYKGFSRDPKPPCPLTFQERWRFAYTHSSSILGMTGLNVMLGYHQ